MDQKPLSLGISISVLIFLSNCVSSNSFLFHHQRCHISHAPSHSELGCCHQCDQKIRGLVYHGEHYRPEYSFPSFRALHRISSAKQFRMSISNCHPDDDPSSGSVLPVKDRIALYSQVSFDVEPSKMCRVMEILVAASLWLFWRMRILMI